MGVKEFKIEAAANGYIVDCDGEKYIYKTKDELLRCEFSYLFEELVDMSDGKMNVIVESKPVES